MLVVPIRLLAQRGSSNVPGLGIAPWQRLLLQVLESHLETLMIYNLGSSNVPGLGIFPWQRLLLQVLKSHLETLIMDKLI